MLDFLEEEYQYNYKVILKSGKEENIDFKTSKGLIEVIDSEEEIEKYKQLKEDFPQEKIMAIGNAKYVAQIKELQDIVYYDKTPQTGSIFLEDASFSFDYAHILPLVEKCSNITRSHIICNGRISRANEKQFTCRFGVAKKIIKEVVNIFDHKFFINKKYLKSEDDSHYMIKFEGPKGMFELQVPKKQHIF